MTVMLAAERTAPVVLPVPRRADALSLTEMSAADVWQFCVKLADTPLLPDQYRRQPASVLWAMEYGRALGLDVVTTISTIHVIKGKPSQSADLMLSRTRAAGHRVRIQPGNGECTVSIFRADDPEFENRVTWTYDDAVTAGLCEIRNDRPWSRSSKGEPQAWEKYPRAMLRARAISECVRMACPEVLHGAIYTPEELGAVIDQDGNPLLDAQPQFARQASGQDAWETAAPAAAPAPLQAPAAAADAPLQQTPPNVVAAGVADIPAESLTPKGRDYLHEAMAAPDTDTVRQIWQDARAEGARPAYLDQIAEVGRSKATIDGDPPQAAPEPPAAEPVADTLPGAPASPQDRLGALAMLYAAGEAAGLSQVETRQVLVQQTGVGLSDASAEQIAAVAADLRTAGGAA